ncbi:hypothetical protein IX306_000643 [Porphyromonas levii]|nr:hypothetical protein [Porphyromonas levii]MBR8766011.1 hypothetical protein [Porphyromonas levii]MBR8773532.1 hypothetical protein [Porphyromonas levii]MBR8801786.1 hypothetical protein [Porphyromonas levii]
MLEQLNRRESSERQRQGLIKKLETEAEIFRMRAILETSKTLREEAIKRIKQIERLQGSINC